MDLRLSSPTGAVLAVFAFLLRAKPPTSFYIQRSDDDGGVHLDISVALSTLSRQDTGHLIASATLVLSLSRISRVVNEELQKCHLML